MQGGQHEHQCPTDRGLWVFQGLWGEKKTSSPRVVVAKTCNARVVYGEVLVGEFPGGGTIRHTILSASEGF